MSDDGRRGRMALFGSLSAACMSVALVSAALARSSTGLKPDVTATTEIASAGSIGSLPEDSQPPADFQALADAAFVEYVTEEYGSAPLGRPPYCVIDDELLATCQTQVGQEVVVALSPYESFVPGPYSTWMSAEELELSTEAQVSLERWFVSESAGLQVSEISCWAQLFNEPNEEGQVGSAHCSARVSLYDITARFNAVIPTVGVFEWSGVQTFINPASFGTAIGDAMAMCIAELAGEDFYVFDVYEILDDGHTLSINDYPSGMRSTSCVLRVLEIPEPVGDQIELTNGNLSVTVNGFTVTWTGDEHVTIQDTEVAPPESQAATTSDTDASLSLIDEGTLFDALLNADDLNASEYLDYLGGEWSGDISEMQIAISGVDTSSSEGACPTGTPFVLAGATASTDFSHDVGQVVEIVMVFQDSSSAESWVDSFDSCVGEHWTCCDDPAEYISMEPIKVAEIGIESVGFVMLNAHDEGGEIAHNDGVALVKLSETVLVVVFFSGDQVVIPYDSTNLDAVTAVVVEKVVAVLCTARRELECSA